MAEAYFFYVGAKVGYWQGDIKKVSEDIAALRPTMLVAVPRVLDRIMAGIEAKIKARGGLAATLFRMGLGSKLKALDRGAAPERVQPNPSLSIPQLWCSVGDCVGSVGDFVVLLATVSPVGSIGALESVLWAVPA